jgi:two-component system, cell cycle sensor histidine kinase and response regulator CckA
VGRGTGLGLATVYGIVRQHNGYIHVESEVNRGTSFLLFFPTVLSRADWEGAEPQAELVKGGNETILLAEDDRLVPLITARLLKDAGYSVLVAEDGKEALALYHQNAGRIHLALLDVIMPNLGGKATGKQIRQINRSLPILYITGYDFNQLESSLVPEMQAELIRKPFAKDELLKLVRKTLDAVSGSTQFIL